jgi:hypothetical protein
LIIHKKKGRGGSFLFLHKSSELSDGGVEKGVVGRRGGGVSLVILQNFVWEKKKQRERKEQINAC